MRSDLADQGDRLAVDREARSAATFVELFDMIVGDFDVVEVLTILTFRCVELLDVAAAGILLADGSGRLQIVGGSNENIHTLAALQIELDEWPSLECFRTGAGREFLTRHPSEGCTVDSNDPFVRNALLWTSVAPHRVGEVDVCADHEVLHVPLLSIVPREWSTFAVTSSFVDGRRTVHVSGELDLATRDVVHGACVVDGGRDVTVDLRAITFLDCSGMSGLLAARRQLEMRGGSLMLVDAVGQPARLLAMLGEVEQPARVVLRSVPG